MSSGEGLKKFLDYEETNNLKVDELWGCVITNLATIEKLFGTPDDILGCKCWTMKDKKHTVEISKYEPDKETSSFTVVFKRNGKVLKPHLVQTFKKWAAQYGWEPMNEQNLKKTLKVYHLYKGTYVFVSKRNET